MGNFTSKSAITSFDELQYFGIVTIDYRAFYNCSALKSITLPETVTSIGNEAFYGCTSLERINLPNSIKSIGSGAFRNAAKVAITSLPNSLETIDGNAFNTCTGAVNIKEIPNKVASIGYGAFLNVKFSKLKILPSTPPAITTSINNIFANSCVFYCNNVDAYRADSNWSAAGTRLHDISEWTD